MLKALSIDLFLIGLIYLLGAFQTSVILRSISYLEILSLSFPMGLGTLTWTLFILSWLGLPITSATIMMLCIVLLIGMILIRHFFRQSQIRRSSFKELRSKLSDRSRIFTSITWAILILLFLSATLVSVGRAYSTWDAIAIWGVKGYGIALEGTIFAGRTWGYHGLNYPLNLPVAISIFSLFSDDVLPGSKLIFPLIFISFIIGIFTFFTRRNVNQTLAQIGTLLLASVPFFFKHATIGYANLVFTMYIVLGALYAMEGIFENHSDDLVMSGFLLGFAVWTRQEGLLVTILLLVALSLTWLITRRVKLKILSWFLPLLCISVTWFIFNRYYGTESQITLALREALTGMGQGHFQLDSIYRILRYAARQMIEPSIWGLLFPSSLFMIILAGPRSFAPKENIYGFGVGITTLIIGIAIFSFYYAVSFREMLLEWWLTTSFNRMILPVGVLMGILAVLAIGSSTLFSNDHE